ncbi:MAG: mucoidy inhibitor MuiA family protein [Spirochaetales bacterium]|nr:mucoidy inhibitor MuiA family protein [Spirochaetales bacterium]
MKEKTIYLPVTEVVLLEDRANIKRFAELTLPSGHHSLLLSEVSPVISDKTLSAKIDSSTDIKISDVRIKRSLKNLNNEDPDKFTDTENKIRELVKKKIDLLNKRSVLLSRIESSNDVLDLLYQEIPIDAAWGKILSSEYIKDIDGIEESIEKSGLLLVDTEKDLEELNKNLDDLKFLADTLQTPSTRYSADIIIDINLEKETIFNLIVEYLVPQACWRPRYRAELKDGKLKFSMDGNVWQNTGEEWKDIDLLFSTQRISLGIEPPVLLEDSIFLQKKPKEEIIEEREQFIQETGLGSSSGNLSDDLPGIDDCGAVQKLHASGHSTIPSDGFPYKAEISSFKTDSVLDLIAIPELSNYVFMRTRHKNNMENPILAGPVDLIRDNGFSGRTTVLFVSPGESFDLAWGPDPDLRINRVETVIEEKSGAISSWTQKRYKISIHISNLGNENKEILIQERIPVSEVEKVKVVFDKIKTSPGFTVQDDNGIVSWKIKLKSLGHDTIVMEYTIKKHKAVVDAGSTSR